MLVLICSSLIISEFKYLFIGLFTGCPLLFSASLCPLPILLLPVTSSSLPICKVPCALEIHSLLVAAILNRCFRVAI